jgi:hypothetical protein
MAVEYGAKYFADHAQEFVDNDGMMGGAPGELLVTDIPPEQVNSGWNVSVTGELVTDTPPEQVGSGWRVPLTGNETFNVRRAAFENPKYYRVELGHRGYPCVTVTQMPEDLRGGVVTVPYMADLMPNGQGASKRYAGFILEGNRGGVTGNNKIRVLGLPGGFVNKGEGVEEAARRETLEETGQEMRALLSRLTLRAPGVNSNRAIVNTSGRTKAGGPRGDNYFGMSIRSDEVVPFDFSYVDREGGAEHNMLGYMLNPDLVEQSAALGEDVENLAYGLVILPMGFVALNAQLHDGYVHTGLNVAHACLEEGLL